MITEELIIKAAAGSIKYITGIIPITAASIFAANLLIQSGFLDKLNWILNPLTKYSGMRRELGMAFLTSMGSPSAANGIMKKLIDDGIINEKELTVTVLANAFPVMLMETRSMLPVMISFLGITGLKIFLIVLSLRFIQTMIALTAGRFIYQHDGEMSAESKKNINILRGFPLIISSIKNSLPTIKRILKITIPVTFLTYLLVETGMFRFISEHILFFTKIFPIPVEGLGIVAAYMGHYVAAYTMAGNVITQGVLTEKEIILTLMTAKVFGSIFFAVRHSIPYYVGIYGTRTGIRLMSINTSVRNILQIIAIFVIYCCWPS